MGYWFKSKPAPPKFRRCGVCLYDKVDTKYDGERLIPMCLSCWSGLGPVGGRNRTPKIKQAP